MKNDFLKDRYKNIFESGKAVLLPFLDTNEQDILLSVTKNKNTYFEGGIPTAEHKRCIITPFSSDKLDFKIVCFKINFSKKFLTVNHRMILGALMGLGIKREAIGDIIIKNNEAYFFATKEMSVYLKDQFKSLNNEAIDLEIVDSIPFEVKIEYEEKMCFVSSLRLDGIISHLYGFSREESHNKITLGTIKVNQALCLNPSCMLKKDDIVSVKGKGRFKVMDLMGQTKSGKLKVILGKLI